MKNRIKALLSNNTHKNPEPKIDREFALQLMWIGGIFFIIHLGMAIGQF